MIVTRFENEGSHPCDATEFAARRTAVFSNDANIAKTIVGGQVAAGDQGPIAVASIRVRGVPSYTGDLL